MTAQELLDALRKAHEKKNIDLTAAWALYEYLREVWKDGLNNSVRPFALGNSMSNFFVDLTKHRLPDRIGKHTPDTESMLLKFFGATEGGLPQFWTQCTKVWSIVLEPYPDYANEVDMYFEMLLRSSSQDKRADSSNVPAEPPAPAAAKNPEKAHVPAPTGGKNVPVSPRSPTVPRDATEPKVVYRIAYLILQGNRVIPLNQPFIAIGRQLDNHIILENMSVSRAHAQIKLINGRFVLFDMNSTGGTYINGQRTSQAALNPGDMISLAGVTFIFSPELPSRTDDMKFIELGSPFAADRPEAVTHRKDVKPKERPDQKDLPALPKTKPL